MLRTDHSLPHIYPHGATGHVSGLAKHTGGYVLTPSGLTMQLQPGIFPLTIN